jgi:hypothetical protein
MIATTGSTINSTTCTGNITGIPTQKANTGASTNGSNKNTAVPIVTVIESIVAMTMIGGIIAGGPTMMTVTGLGITGRRIMDNRGGPRFAITNTAGVGSLRPGDRGEQWELLRP